MPKDSPNFKIYESARTGKNGAANSIKGVGDRKDNTLDHVTSVGENLLPGKHLKNLMRGTGTAVKSALGIRQVSDFFKYSGTVLAGKDGSNVKGRLQGLKALALTPFDYIFTIGYSTWRGLHGDPKQDIPSTFFFPGGPQYKKWNLAQQKEIQTEIAMLKQKVTFKKQKAEYRKNSNRGIVPDFWNDMPNKSAEKTEKEIERLNSRLDDLKNTYKENYDNTTGSHDTSLKAKDAEIARLKEQLKEKNTSSTADTSETKKTDEEKKKEKEEPTKVGKTSKMHDPAKKKSGSGRITPKKGKSKPTVKIIEK